jgi:hypothetical protein
MDDENTMIFNWMHAVVPDRPLNLEQIERQETWAGRAGPEAETMVRIRTKENDWLVDREEQRTKTFTGIKGLNTQDLAAQESMGPIADRTREHLGTTDRAIIVLRRILLDVVGDHQEGIDPLGLDPNSYRDVRAADAVLPKDVPWQEAGKELLVARV